MGFESRAISARVTKQIVTIFSKTCDNKKYKPFHQKTAFCIGNGKGANQPVHPPTPCFYIKSFKILAS